VIGPVWQVPLWWVILVGLCRTLGVLVILAVRHPGMSVPLIGSAAVLLCVGRDAYLTGLAIAAALLVAWGLLHRASWVRLVAAVLDEAVRVMKARQARLRGGNSRLHTPTAMDPLLVVLVDEMAGLSAYCQDAQLRKRMGQSLSLLLSQGRGVGVLVVGALQDPRKDVLPFRDLFPTRIALRLTEASHVDMVLGDGARNRGAVCDQIPDTQPGVGYVALDGVREPMRVRAAYVTDEDIAAMATEYPTPHRHASRPAPLDEPGEESAV
jgi:DNA segregation ATPase FtsK/SpoIIIE-like protein